MSTELNKLLEAEQIALHNARETAKRLKRVAFMQEFQKRGIVDGTFITCTNCDDFDVKTESCMRFQQRPPAAVIVTGCEYWDRIPF